MMPESFFQWWGWAFGLSMGHWYVTVFLKPSHWAIDWHANETCCKRWLVIGPLEIIRMWSDDDEYPFDLEE